MSLGDARSGKLADNIVAFGRALRMAAEPDARAAGTIPSTKGSL